MNKIKIIIAFLFVCNVSIAQNVKPAFWNEIQNFKRQDSISMPAKNQILFVGSSSFTKWTDVQDYFPTHKIINRGFGGSTLLDLIRYNQEVILKYKPKQIIIYCGENDFASSDSVSVQMLTQRFIKLFEIIRTEFKKTPIAYVSMKPSPRRLHLMKKYLAANEAIKIFLKEKPATAFIDVYPAMLNEDGSPIAEIFIKDNLHMNAQGYQIWQKIIEPFLLK